MIDEQKYHEERERKKVEVSEMIEALDDNKEDIAEVKRQFEERLREVGAAVGDVSVRAVGFENEYFSITWSSDGGVTTHGLQYRRNTDGTIQIPHANSWMIPRVTDLAIRTGESTVAPSQFLPNLLDGTEKFMRLAGQLDDDHEPRYNQDPYDEFMNFRHSLFEEEFREYTEAMFGTGDKVEKLDGILDMIVILWGTALAEYGPEKANAAAAEVVRSNLSKVDGSLGPLVKREDGKIMKPEGWTPPDIAGVLS